MLAFEVSKNGDVMYVAGMDKWSSMTTIIRAMDHPRMGKGVTLYTAIPGSSGGPPKSLDWGQLLLTIGDEITIRIVETDETDPPKEPDDSGIKFVSKLVSNFK